MSRAERSERVTGQTDHMPVTVPRNKDGKPADSRTSLLLRGLAESGLCMIYQDRDLRMLLVENAPPAFPPAADILANGDAAIFGLADCARLREAKCDVFATGKPTRLELALEDRGTNSLWFEVHIEPDRDAETIRGLFVAISDISDIKRRELTLRSLLFEVSHRAHNMLTILQALISLTARQSGSIADFETKFRGRIASLALSQDLATRANWEGVRLSRLVEWQTAPLLRSGMTPPQFSGADPTLGPNAALHIGLALHELAASALAVGETTHPCIEISGDTIATGHSRLTWIVRRFSPTPGTEARMELGRSILESIVARAVAGHVECHRTEDSFVYRITWKEPPAVH